MLKKHLMMFNSKSERDASIENNILDINSVSIWGGYIQYGIDNYRKIKGTINYDDEEENNDSSSMN